MKDLSVVEKQVNNKLKTLPYDSKVEYSQGFIDGLISLNYNMGYGNMFGNTKFVNEMQFVNIFSILVTL